MAEARLRGSVFAKLLAIMVGMAASLLLLVIGFFAGVLLPTLGMPVQRVVEEYVRVLAATQPDLAEAKRIASRADVQIRYEGPDGTWSTSSGLPPIAQARVGPTPRVVGARGDYVAPAPNGGAYLVRWTFRRQVAFAHDVMLVLLGVLMIAVVIVTYFVLKRLLRPLRTLGDGVAQLSAGQLDIVLPNPTRDEFGALTDAFNRMVGRVREMIRARDRLLLDVSHELRSPVTRLRVALELLPEGPDRAHMIADVEEMEAMLAELLELERLRDGRAIRTAPHDLMAILRSVAPNAAGPAELMLDVDAEKMRIVFRNLVENAAKYAGGATEVSVALDASSVAIRVRDQGPGIPPEDLPSLFEPFFRVNRSRSKTPAGYGLGLSICKRIVEAHGGTIVAENDADRGASFTITLPK